MSVLLIVVLIMLLIFAVIDFYTTSIPSIFLTGIILVVATVEFTQIVPFGMLSLIAGVLLYEADFYSGVADIKVMVIIGLLVKDLWFFMGLVIMVLILGVTWKIAAKKILKEEYEVAFIPVFVFTYVGLWIVGGLI